MGSPPTPSGRMYLAGTKTPLLFRTSKKSHPEPFGTQGSPGCPPSSLTSEASLVRSMYAAGSTAGVGEMSSSLLLSCASCNSCSVMPWGGDSAATSGSSLPLPLSVSSPQGRVGCGRGELGGRDTSSSLGEVFGGSSDIQSCCSWPAKESIWAEEEGVVDVGSLACDGVGGCSAEEGESG